MNNVIKFSAINTKIKALKSNLITNNQYFNLLNFKDYRKILVYLKENTDYRNVFYNYDINSISIEDLQYMLKRNYLRIFLKLTHYFIGNYKKFFYILFLKFEIEDLKILLRGKYLDEDTNFFITRNFPLSNINYDKLIESKGLKECVNGLKGTIYYKDLCFCFKNVKYEGLFRTEMTLDSKYLNLLINFSNKLDKQDKIFLRKIIGIYIDLFNLEFIFRGKKIYKLNAEKLQKYVINNGYKLNKKDLIKCCYVENINDFFQILNKLPYRNIFNNIRINECLYEKNIFNYFIKILIKYKKKAKLNISLTIMYLGMLLLEIKNIIAIVEGKKYNMMNKELMNYIFISNN